MNRALTLAALAALGAGAAAGGGAAGDPQGLMAMSARPGQPVIARTWHGKTLRATADEYERYLTEGVKKFPTIPGNLGYQVMRLDGGPDGDGYVEFQVVSYWTSLDAIHAYAGADIRKVRDLPRDAELLVGKEAQVRNYALVVNAIRP
ncbi:MAG TPA: antibiotic biosynthesis monooxygenase [Anaeromyxobacteraceae bacterium]|nr:antibiotic biosynthesis monooxygenase [Anaeromyxobacteraceae bacterium]